MALFIFIESASRILVIAVVLTDRGRGAAYITMAIAAVAMFGTFLLTYHLQGIMGFSPVKTGAAFLPMTLVLMTT